MAAPRQDKRSTQAASPQLCRVETSALLLIDIQPKLTAAMPAKVLARLQRNVSMLLQAADQLRVPVFASEQHPDGLGRTEPDLARLLPEGARTYAKTAFSLATHDDFRADLAASGRSQIILTGMEAHICVLQTAIELQAAGHDVYLVADAVCSRHRENYETALARLRRAGVVVCDAESVLFEWLRDARHPQFKPLQALVR